MEEKREIKKKKWERMEAERKKKVMNIEREVLKYIFHWTVYES